MAPPPTNGNERVTVGELARRFDDFRLDYRESIAGLHRRLDDLNVVHVDVYEADKRTAAEQRASLDARVAALELANAERDRSAEATRQGRINVWVAPVVVAVVAALIIAVVLRGVA